VKKILIIRLAALGDTLHTTPCLKALKEAYPKSSLTYIVGKGAEPVIENNPYIDEIIIFDKRGNHKTWSSQIRLALYLRKKNFDIVANMSPSTRTLTFSFIINGDKKLLYRRDKEPDRGVKAAHAVENCWATFDSLRIKYDKTALIPQFFITHAEKETVSKLIASIGITGKDKIIGINPGASHQVNRWDANSFALLSDRLIRDLKTKIIIVGGPSDIEIASSIENKMEETPVNLAGKLSIRESAALFERCCVFVTGDTGPMHIAAAAGVPVVALFGAADPDRTGPVGRRHIIIQKKDLECVPCRKRVCSKNHECMKDITVDEIFAACGRAINIL